MASLTLLTSPSCFITACACSYFVFSVELLMFPKWGQGVEEPQSVKDDNCGLHRPQVICSFQGPSQHLLGSGFGG